MKEPRVLRVATPHFCNQANGDGPQSHRIIAESQQLGPAYRAVAEAQGCGFFDAASVAKASDVDGVHLDAANTRAIGAALIAPVGAQLTLSDC